MLRYTTDISRPGLVALYDIRPGNGAGQFLQPRSLHRATKQRNCYCQSQEFFSIFDQGCRENRRLARFYAQKS